MEFFVINDGEMMWKGAISDYKSEMINDGKRKKSLVCIGAVLWRALRREYRIQKLSSTRMLG